MKKITNQAELRSAIYELEARQASEWPLLRDQFLKTTDSFKPLNIIKDTFREITVSPGLKGNLIDATLGVAVGVLSQAVVVGASHNPIKKLVGAFIQMGISNVVAKNPDTIRSLAGSVINFFSKKKIGEIPNH